MKKIRNLNDQNRFEHLKIRILKIVSYFVLRASDFYKLCLTN